MYHKDSTTTTTTTPFLRVFGFDQPSRSQIPKQEKRPLRRHDQRPWIGCSRRYF